jgi:hypothetical protein
MKTIFSMGFPSQASIWMGQPTGMVTSGGIDYALDLYKRVQDWVSKTSNPADWLGTDYPFFQNAKAKSEGLYPDVIDLAETLDTGGTLSTSENALANQFYDATTIAWGAIVQHPTPASAVMPSAFRPAARPAGAPVAPSTKAAAAAKSVPVSTGPSTNDLLLGGGLAVGVGAVLYALTRG